jgi:hypothetical protein
LSDDMVFLRPYVVKGPFDQVSDFLCTWSSITFAARPNPEDLPFRLNFNLEFLSQIVG